MTDYTKVHVIDGREYKEVERRANVGDYVYVKSCKESPEVDGKTGKCIENDTFYDGSIDVDIPSQVYGNRAFLDANQDEFYTLEPVEEITPVQSFGDALDLIANLARRVSSLESQLSDAQGNIERQAEELEEYRDDYLACGAGLETLDKKVEMLTDDIVMLDERTQPKAKEVDATDFNDFIGMVADRVAEKLVRGERQ